MPPLGGSEISIDEVVVKKSSKSAAKRKSSSGKGRKESLDHTRLSSVMPGEFPTLNPDVLAVAAPGTDSNKKRKRKAANMRRARMSIGEVRRAW